MPHRIVIIGSGLAGASAAVSLRERGFDGELLLFGRESHKPYELPALSKGFLLGEADEPDWVTSDNFYADRGIDLRLGASIEELRLDEHVVVDAAGVAHPFDRLLLATGSTPRRLLGSERAGVRVLRSLDDAIALRAALTDTAKVLVIGAGWIGCEVAAAARSRGAEVTVVAPEAAPLERVLGAEMGRVFQQLHSEHGVVWRLGEQVAEFAEGSVTLADGSRLVADVVVLGVGRRARPPALRPGARRALGQRQGAGHARRWRAAW
jgi:3-phenylpropionate/trans-cinnamate dioxygenase ferredoxin reductase subunit